MDKRTERLEEDEARSGRRHQGALEKIRTAPDLAREGRPGPGGMEASRDSIPSRVEPMEARRVERTDTLARLRETPDYVPRASKGGGELGSEVAEERELERRIAEADRVWQEDGEARAQFAREFGVDTHAYKEARIREAEQAAGRMEGPGTFEVERTITCLDGREMRVDYWDHEARAIDDIKPASPDETVGELVEKHKDQLLRYARAAEECEGEKVESVGIRPYPGTQTDTRETEG